METTEIQERNKQIALMLGYKTTWLDKLFYTWKCRFLYDWNLLMETVEFIEKFKIEISIIKNECSIIDTEKAELEENPFMIEPISKCFDAETKKEAVFIAVSDFAKLYNNKEL
jgi:hypothetical protein